MKDHRLERLIFFSDAVIAIAITLLIIEIHAPRLPHGDVAGALQMLRELLPAFFGFAISFMVIGRFWLGHSAAMGGMIRIDERLFRPNLYFLMMIVVMPFSTAFLSENLGELVAVAFYNATLTLTALASLAVVMIATDPDSGCSAHDPAERADLRRRSQIVVGAAAACVALGLVRPDLGQLPMIALLLGDRLTRRRKSASA